jgi:hypothetical protein
VRKSAENFSGMFFLAETEVLAYIPSRFFNGKIPSEGD